MDVQIRGLKAEAAIVWKHLRLRALQESPDAFRTTYDSQLHLSDSDWQRQVEEIVGSQMAEGFLAQVDGEPVGMLRCGISDKEPSRGFIRTMWVDPSFRKHGVGSELLAFATRWLRDRGVEAIELDVNERNEPATSLYRRFGFRPTGYREPLREGSDQWIVRMQFQGSEEWNARRRESPSK